jgi:hypothetical protein
MLLEMVVLVVAAAALAVEQIPEVLGILLLLHQAKEITAVVAALKLRPPIQQGEVVGLVP